MEIRELGAFAVEYSFRIDFSTSEFFSEMISPSDLFLAPEISEEEVCRYLESFGFRDPFAADANLQHLAEEFPVRQALGSMAAELMDSLSRTPDPDGALVGLERYLSARTGKVTFLSYLREDPQALDLLLQVLGTSPFLSEMLIRNPEYFHWLCHEFDRGPYDSERYQEEVDLALQSMPGLDARLDALKRFKRRDLLRIATRDILGKETLQSATLQLSDLADITVDRALEIVREGQDDQGRNGALSVIGMGKLGGRELNYSSDIDLIYVSDPAAPGSKRAPRPRPKQRGPQADEESLQKLARDLTHVLTEYTSESYLYRVDLRLRPLGKGGQIAYSLQQSRHYYETWGETFERFAMLKARPIAGDPALGQRFMEMIQPFVYRKYLDHAALEEIVRIKARADADSLRQGGGEEDVKTGYGGIREVELFTQILQMLYSGDRPEIREANTLAALEKLLRARLISETVCEDLTQTYIFLRTVEHRLQIVQGRQLHSLPADKIEREICARRMGFQSVAEFAETLQGHRARVHEIYQSLLHEKGGGACGLSAREFLRSLNGEVPEEEMLRRLSDAGFRNPGAVVTAFRALDEAPSLAHSRSTTRNLLANLLSVLLPETARCAQPETVLNRLEQLASETGAASSFFRSLLENELLRRRLVLVLDSGELLSQRLIRYPELMDSLVLASEAEAPLSEDAARPVVGDSPDFSLKSVLQRVGRMAETERLNELRRVRLAEEFKIVLRWLSGGSLSVCQSELSLLAEHCVRNVAQWHDPGRDGTAAHKRAGKRQPVPDWVIFALGKLGSRELTVHSDLDLVFLYRGDPGDSGMFLKYQNFVEAVQRSLEQPTSHGIAYRMDTRLRPEGNKGALAVPAATFGRYLETRAEIWERLAWTRARFLAGSEALGREISRTVQSFVYGAWDAAIPESMDRIRSRMEAELSRESEGERYDFKVGRGGLADIDFLMQMIQIREGRSREDFRISGTRELLPALAETRRALSTGLLSQKEAQTLHDSYCFLRRLEGFARMESDSNVNWISASAETLVSLGRRMEMRSPEGHSLLHHYRETTGRVRRIYSRVVKRLRML